MENSLVTFHPPSKTIVEADLLFNLPAKQQYAGNAPGGLTRLMNVLTSYSVWSRRFLWYIGCKDEAQMRKAAAIVSTWDFENLIPCHGDVLLGNGKDAWEWVFDRFIH